MEKTDSNSTTNSNSNSISARDGLGKLLPKSISDKRRRRREAKARELEGGDGKLTRSSTSSMMLSSDDGNNSPSNGADDDERSLDGRSFGSFESGPEPESAKGSKKSSIRNASRNASRSPSRPAHISPHPSLIGYLTTSSPVVQATHLNSPQQTQSPVSPRSAAASVASSRGSGQVSTIPDLPAVIPALVEPLSITNRKSTPSPDKKPRSSKRSQISHETFATPENKDEDTPSIVNTLKTTSQRLADESPLSKRVSSRPGSVIGTDGVDSSRAGAGHTRSASASSILAPSKLSNVLSNSLTPTTEEPTPLANPAAGSGFFSSVFSAAQNAANNFSNNLQTTGFGIGGPKGRAVPAKTQENTPRIVVESESAAHPMPAVEMDQKDSAVRTIGSGDLSLSHLGLDEPPSSVVSPASARFNDVVDTRARSESAPADTQMSDFSMDEAGSRPRSLNEHTPGTMTPPLAELDDKLVSRTGSLRSSAAQVHRKRGSSVTTGGTSVTIGATIHSPVMNPAANLSTQKLTGFAIASKKRNRDFHGIFKSVPDDDYLIEDYSCALQREILAHGRLYVSEGHLCFSSNILGWTTTLVMSFDEIVSVEKRSTALLFKNGLMISTLQAKHVFASFTSRDATYDLIVNIWKLGHPTLTSTLNGVRLEGTGGDKTEKLDAEPLDADTQAGSESEVNSSDDEEDEEEFYDEEENDLDAEDQSPEPTGGDAEPEKAVTRKASGMTTVNGAVSSVPKDANSALAAVDFPGPTSHAPTECGDAATHYDKVVGDEIIQAPLGKVYNLMFGQASVAWMSKFLTEVVKGTELQMDDKKGLSLDNRTRSYNYIKPLNASIGPRSTKCITSETLDNLDLEKAVNVTMTTQTPDVPSGNVFSVKTKYCLSWAENNATRVQVNCTVEWTGKSWLKGPIDKAANDGQAQYSKDIFTALRSAVTTRSRAGTGTNGASKPKKKSRKSKAHQSTHEGTAQTLPEKAKKQDWGVFEPIRLVLEPVTDLLKPLLTGNVMYGLLVGLLVSTWFGFGLTPRKSVSPYGPQFGTYGPDRLAAYEETWRREDSELWDWLEERVGLDRLSSDAITTRKRVTEPRTVQEKLREERMEAREVEEAIRVTEEKLRILKEAVVKEKTSQSAEATGQGTT